MRGEQAIFNLEIKKKSGLSINPDIHHSKVFSSEQNLIFIQFWKSMTFFIKTANFFDLIFNVCKEKIFTIEKEVGREASWKPSILDLPYVWNVTHRF